MTNPDEKIDVFSEARKIWTPPEEVRLRAWVSDYESVYQKAVADPEAFWSGIASELDWFQPWTQVLEWRYPWAKWFLGARCNITYNCLDRHVKTWRRNKVALLWVGEDGSSQVLTYGELHRQVCRFASGLKTLGIKKGDRVMIYMPRIPQQFVAMLAVARVGAIHSVVYSGFSALALRERIEDAEAKLVVTADVGFQRGKSIQLKAVVDEAVEGAPSVQHVVVVRRQSPPIEIFGPRERDWDALLKQSSAICEAESMDSEDPLYTLYTSGTTGRPKGVLHVHGGYMVGTYITTKWVFDLKDEDVYFCTADPGWVTGHSYIVYGPLLNGATILFAEGAPDYPDPGRWWKLIEQHGVTIFYTTPTAIRSLMRYGDEWPASHDLSSLRILGTVGEPINPEAWLWYHRVTGERCPIMDTWWQTETGMTMITPLPGVPLKPGSATRPFPGIVADVLDKDGKPMPPNKGGSLVIKTPWPSMLRTVYKDPDRYEQYWRSIPNVYTAGDVAYRDDDGYFWILGRSDDVLKVSGYRLGTAEVESAIVSHAAVAEAAAIGKPDPLKGEAIKVFVILKQGYTPGSELREEIKAHVRHTLGPIAVPSELEFTTSLPKTRSGKIMRRVLKAKELGLETGDTSTLEE
ncbi:MAG: acetate--CoA ligase [Acidobacteria bacterium]|nr:acetate--CoA ligase [Acidobacteriota bacterium]